MTVSPPRWTRPYRADRLRVGASAILAIYGLAAVLSYDASRDDGTLGLTVEPCGDATCVAWVMPAGNAWYDGARPGMRVVRADDRLPDRHDPAAITQAKRLVLSGREDRRLEVRVVGARDTTFWRSLWTLGFVFAGLGALVVLRRGDLPAARWFGVFSLACAVTLAVGPAAEGPRKPWALATVFAGLLAVGAASFGFVAALTRLFARRAAMAAFGTACGFFALYLLSVVALPRAYPLVRAAGFLFVAVAIVASIGTLAVTVARGGGTAGALPSRTCLIGIAVGALPFVALSLVPTSFGTASTDLLEMSVLLVGFMPAAFAYAIMRHEMLGIRTLVHRGLVYASASVVTLAVIAIVVGVLGRPLVDRPLAIAGLVVLGVLLFSPLRWGARRLIDRVAYGADVDHAKVIGAVHGDIVVADQHSEAASVLLQRVVDALHLESAVLLLGDRPGDVRPSTTVGERADDVIRAFQSGHTGPLTEPPGTEVLEARWESNALLISPLLLSGRFIGYAIWGPKRRGDVFIESERRLIAMMTPILTLVLEERSLSDQRRELNDRLMRATEDERARLAADLHDGPLQKAILLSRRDDAITVDPQRLAREVVQELREVCTRLRPAILDDLGLISALDWLVGEMSQRSAIRADLRLQGLDEVDRFEAETELALFRVAQEAMNNVLKHSGASAVEVELTRRNGGLSLTVRDDGKGFTPTARGTGLGLMGMRERVRHVGGDIRIESAPNRGTQVNVRVPIADEEQRA